MIWVMNDPFLVSKMSAGPTVCARFKVPTRFTLIAAMDPTPDGKMPDESRCSPREIQNYLGRISGPLLDRIDLHIEVPSVPFDKISGLQSGENSETIRHRVIQARNIQLKRFARKHHISSNASMTPRALKECCVLDEASLELMKQAMSHVGLSARAYDRILKVARTIADLAGKENITSEHIMEATQFRELDRQIWT